MKYLIIGLGTLGRAIAQDLTLIGNEVIAIDINMEKVDSVKEYTSGAICLDSTDKDALKSLPLSEMDAVFVTYGKDFGISVQTVALLKSLGVDNLIVRSISLIHETVIRTIGVKEIMTPERDYSAVYASQSILGGLFKHWYDVTETHHVYKILAPKTFSDQKFGNINLIENFNVRLIAIERPMEKTNMIGIKSMEYEVIEELDNEFIIKENDVLIVFGKTESLHQFASLK